MDNIIGILPGDWFKILKNNHFKISPNNWLKAAYVTGRSFSNKKYKAKEDELYKKAIEETKIEHPPVFIIGHWRSGTTFLHNILSQDHQFAFPNLFEANNPHTFLVKHPFYESRIKHFQSRKRKMDNVHVGLDSPIEEEFAIAIMCLKSPLIGWMFPKRQHYYDKYLTFENAPEDDKNKWMKAMDYFLKKLTYKYKRPLLLKSPSNTCKIKMLLTMYPGAKFIHIHRNPYEVFTSTRNLYQTAVKASSMQKTDYSMVDDYILDQYKTLYDKYFEEKPLIPDKQFAEVAYSELEDRPLDTIRYIYTQLNLHLSVTAEQSIQTFIKANTSYKKNKYELMNSTLRDSIYSRWNRSFEAWKYQR